MADTTTPALPSVIRTVVPYLTALLIAKLAEWGLDINPGDAQGLVVAVVGSVYYVAVRFVEQKWPNAGWLLGSKRQPQYLPRGEQP